MCNDWSKPRLLELKTILMHWVERASGSLFVLRGHEMFKCKAKDSAPTTEEDLDTMQIRRDVLAFYNYARRIDFQGTLKEFVHQTVILLFDTCARQKGIQLVVAEEMD